MQNGLYEQDYQKKNRFSFGKNWQSFIEKMTPQRQQAARDSLTAFLGSIKGKTFADVGCGSGLFSLAAYQNGAKVTSIDADEFSVAATSTLRERFGSAQRWTIKKGSVLDTAFVKKTGTYDIVYSWGVLHHTGSMHKAFDNVDLLVKKGGVLFIAIYNDNTKHKLEGTSHAWVRIKRSYNRAGKARKWLMRTTYATYLLAGITAKGKNPVRYVKNYESLRGMDFWHDIADWMGGYPYEYATVEQVSAYFAKKGYSLEKTTRVRSLGCNELLFKKR